ncbi:MAG: hypothetical protein ACR2QK_01890, partial [Acidimicrobiales bacterium]
AAFSITGATATGITFGGELTFTTRQGTLTLDLTGSLDLSTGEFASTGPVRSGTGRFDGAVGSISLDGLQDLADPAGGFTEHVVGEVCVDPGRRRS